MSVNSTNGSASGVQPEEGGSIPAFTLHPSDLRFEVCQIRQAIEFNLLHHSRLPVIRNIGIKYAFRARVGDQTIITALWTSPVAIAFNGRNYLELRRMACCADVPKNGASAFLSWMVRYIRRHSPEYVKLISYQDTAVHTGTIYRAAGWTAAHTTKSAAHWTERKTKQGKLLNGTAVMSSFKTRWELDVTR